MTTQTKKVGIGVSAYDRAAGWVISWNILVGFAVGLLLLIWLGTVRDFERGRGDRPQPLFGWADGSDGAAQDLETPGTEEMAQETRPEFAQLLQAVTDVVATEAAELDALPVANCSTSSGSPRGDSRLPGPKVDQPDVVPRGERWQVQYNSNSIEAYRRQLDHFHIELGAVGGGQPYVDYARNLQQDRPDTRRGKGDAEKRLYMLWAAGTLKRFDRQLLRAAGIPTAGRIVLQFYPQSIAAALSQVEMAYAAEHGITRVERIEATLFGVRKAKSGFEYYVVSQRYRTVAL